MRRYETTFIVNPQADDAAIDRQVLAVIDLIKTDGGRILNENRLGTRRMAYPIADLVQGFYTSLIFEAETTVLPKMDRHYKLEDPYIRYLTIRYEGPIPSDEDVEAVAQVKESEQATSESKPTEGGNPEVKADPVAEKPAEEPEVEVKPEEPEVEAKPEEPKVEVKPEEQAADKNEPSTDQPDPADEEL